MKGLGHLDQIAPIVRDLDQRSRRYGITGVHSATVGAAFLWTVEKCFDDQFTQEIEEAETASYGIFAAAM